MTDATESVLKVHYGTPGILANIVAGLEKGGKTIDTALPADLKGVDEFHMGGVPATMHFMETMEFGEDDQVLDAGCGIGGVARDIAAKFKVASIDGVDLTPEYVEVGNEINSWPLIKESFLGGVCPKLQQGSILSLPYPDASFTKIVMMHVGMNIEDKETLFREFGRVLKPGGRVGVYDIMRLRQGVDLPYPMPWSSAPETSFVQTPAHYLACMEGAGLVVKMMDNRREATMQILAKQVAAMKEGATNPIQLGILMGETGPAKGANASRMVKECVIGPIELISSKL
mmetsp:Transcript_2066/g.4062  ORF Transcript_2066/g.4062 Transcript_2066/m.4062 type:complete len:286 (-) Transcript_2066:100-957(-)